MNQKERIKCLRDRVSVLTLSAGFAGLFIPIASGEAMPGWIWPAWVMYAAACYLQMDMEKNLRVMGEHSGFSALLNSMLFCLVSTVALGMQISASYS